MSNFPAGASYQNLIMFCQNTLADVMMQFDYGPERNLAEYGTEIPPRVPLENLEMPVALLQGNSDLNADPVDVQWLYDQITDQVVFRQMYNLGHLSFTLAKDMSYFTDVVNLLEQYSTNAFQ